MPALLKRCSKCGGDKPLNEFHADKSTKDGRQYRCAVCQALYQRTRLRDQDKRAQHTLRCTEWRTHNPDKWKSMAASAKAKYNASEFGRKMNTARSRAWREANPDKVIEINARNARNNPNTKRAINARRRARKANAPQGDPADAAAYAEILREGICELCGAKGPIHVDHIEALSSGGEHGWENFAGLCPPCNASKGAKPLLIAMLSH